jgi:rRNA-processing protein FCF1
MQKITSFIERLKNKLQTIEDKMLKFLDESEIERLRDDPNSPIVFIGPPFYWKELKEIGKIMQMELKKLYSEWFEHFYLLLTNASNQTIEEAKETNSFITEWIEHCSGWSTPSTIEEAKTKFKEGIKFFYDYLKILRNSRDNSLILIPDTNSLIDEPDITKYSCLVGTSQYTIILLPTVLEELDKLKIHHREPKFRNKIESIIRRIKGFRNQGELSKGVTINKSITVKAIAMEPDFNKTLKWLDYSNNDDKIIASALEVQKEYPSATVILLTSDINLQNKADMAELPTMELP